MEDNLVLQLKRGDTLKIPISATSTDTAAFNLAGATLKVQLRTRHDRRLIGECAISNLVTAADALSAKATIAKEDTAKFPVGKLVGDIEFTLSNGERYTSESNFSVNVHGDITK